jgi:hypothetical protein
VDQGHAIHGPSDRPKKSTLQRLVRLITLAAMISAPLAISRVSGGTYPTAPSVAGSSLRLRPPTGVSCVSARGPPEKPQPISPTGGLDRQPELGARTCRVGADLIGQMMVTLPIGVADPRAWRKARSNLAERHAARNRRRALLTLVERPRVAGAAVAPRAGLPTQSRCSNGVKSGGVGVKIMLRLARADNARV